MSYLRPVQPLIASLITDLPDTPTSAGLKDAIIFVEEGGSVRRWDANLQQWTRRGGPVVGTASILNTPIPMSQISQPVKTIIDAITASGFATAAQGGKADSALQTVILATLSANGLISAADFANLQFLVSLLQFSRRPQVVKHSVSIGTANSDALILTASDMPAKYLITRLSVFNASSALSTVTAGLYTSPNGVGAIVGPSTITAANATVYFDFSSLPLTVRTNTPLYLHVTTPKTGATISLLIEFLNLT